MFRNYNELLSSYVDFFKCDEDYSSAHWTYRYKNQTSNNKLIEDNREISIGSFNSLEFVEIISILTVFMNFIHMKKMMCRRLRRSKFLDSLGLRAKDREKLDECVWRLIFYGLSSTWLIYSCFFKRKSQIYLTEYSFEVDFDEYLICIIEIGFYLHALYAIVFEDIWRKDSPVVIVHHLAAIFTFTCMYATRTHKLGLIAVLLRDTCDVLLEISKLNMSVKVQHGKVVKSLDNSLKVLFVVFTASFVVNQLYYYPLYCLYHALNLIRIHRLKTLAVKGIIACAFLFLILDLFWFFLLIKLIVRMIFFSEPMTDLREYDQDEEEKELKSMHLRDLMIAKSKAKKLK